MVEFSIVIPVFNEAENLTALTGEIDRLIEAIKQPCEVIWVDDGSTDGSFDLIRKNASLSHYHRYVRFSRNYGQSAALSAGFKASRGKYIITLDSDLQNDPADVLKMIPLLSEYDMVTGWRQKRQDTWWKKLSSRFANGIRNRLSRETIRDTGCSLKIMRADYLKQIKMYNGMHRFLPTLMKMEGARVTEVPVNHRPRVCGKSKYGTWDRAFSGLRDLLAIRWMQDRQLAYTIQEIEDQASPSVITSTRSEPAPRPGSHVKSALSKDWTR